MDVRAPGRTVWKKVPFCTPTGGQKGNLRAPIRLDDTRSALSESRATRGRTSLGILLGLAAAILIAAAWLPGALAPRSTVDSGSAQPEPVEMTEPLDLAAGDADPTGRPPLGLGDARRKSAQPALTTVLLLSLQDEAATPYESTWSVDWFHIRSTAPGTSGRTEGSGSSVEIAVEAPGPYRVNVRAPGGGRTDSVAERLAGTDVVAARFDASEARVPITLHPSGWLTGSLVDQHGAPLEGIGVWFHPRPDSLSLERQDPSGRSAYSVEKSDVAGRFAFDLGAARAGQIRVGDQLHPWVPPIEFGANLVNRRLELDPIRLELFAATFDVRTWNGLAVAGARLEGTGLEGGHCLTTTDIDGRARVENMPRGRWRVLAQHAEHGRANRAVEIPLAQDEPVVLVLPR